MYIFKWFSFKFNITIALAALALVGTCFEIYNSVLTGVYDTFKNKWFTKRKDKVLTTEKQEIS
jgi:hypothetical protein